MRKLYHDGREGKRRKNHIRRKKNRKKLAKMEKTLYFCDRIIETNLLTESKRRQTIVSLPNYLNLTELTVVNNTKVIMRKRHLLFTAIAMALCPMMTQAKQVTNPLQKGNYLLYNVQAKQYLCGGNAWGTRASLGEVGILVGIDPAADADGNTTSVISTKPYFDKDKDLRKDGFLDQSTKQQYIFKAVEGKENTYTISFVDGDEVKSLYYDPASPTLVSIGTPAGNSGTEWQLVTIDPSDASKDHPVDMSYLVRGGDFNDRSDNHRWQGDKPAYSHNNSDAADRCAEFYSKNFDMYQEITGLPNGDYQLSCQGFYRRGSILEADSVRATGKEELNALLYANDQTTPLQSILDEAGKNGEVGKASEGGFIPNSMTDAESYFAQGLYKDNVVKVTVTDGTLRVGIKKTQLVNNDWTLFDKVRLSYLGEDQSALLAAAEAAYQAQMEKAAQAISSDDYIIVQGGERTQLAQAIALQPEPTVEGYTEVTAKIKAALETFTAAQPTYAAYNKEIDDMVSTAEALGVKDADAYRVKISAETYAADLIPALNKLNEAQYRAVTDAGYKTSAEDMTLATWTANDGDSFKLDAATRQRWYGADRADVLCGIYYEVHNGWNDGPWQHGMQKNVTLPAGQYVLQFACRTSTDGDGSIAVITADGKEVKASFPMKNDSGLGININGETSFDATDSFANNGAGYGWEWRFVPFTLTETATVNFALTLTAHAVHQYPGLTDPTLLVKEIATGINNTEVKNLANNADEAVYNLQGQRVEKISKGIYIVKGKKIVK